MYNEKQLAWAKSQIHQIMTGDKTRYKELIANPEKLLEMENALLDISQAKILAYEQSKNGITLDSFNHVSANKKLADSSLLLQQHLISLAEISMMPNLN